VSDPREFNDPFEFCPQPEKNITGEDVAQKLTDTGFLVNIYQRNSTIRQQYPTIHDFFQNVKSDSTKWTRFFLEKFSDQAKFPPNTFADLAAKHLGVMCFSQVCDDILMWSHYADCHRGMVIEFDAKRFGGDMDVVEYSTERASYNPVFDVEGFEHWARVMRRKSRHWSYEKELRLLV
jgi:hypothetical protein